MLKEPHAHKRQSKKRKVSVIGAEPVGRYAVRINGLDGLIVTKLDGSAKGGVVVPILERLKLPIAFVGVGEQVDDLIPFDAEAFVDGLLDL